MTYSPSLDVLVVDDEFLIRWAIARTLSTAGHRVREASDAASAVAALAGRRLPDVALVDYRLPDVRGLELVQTLRALAPGMTIVMMTADRIPDLDAVHDLGVRRVLDKPFDMATLEATLLAAHIRLSVPQPPAADARQ